MRIINSFIAIRRGVLYRNHMSPVILWSFLIKVIVSVFFYWFKFASQLFFNHNTIAPNLCLRYIIWMPCWNTIWMNHWKFKLDLVWIQTYSSKPTRFFFRFCLSLSWIKRIKWGQQCCTFLCQKSLYLDYLYLYLYRIN